MCELCEKTRRAIQGHVSRSLSRSQLTALNSSRQLFYNNNDDDDIDDHNSNW